MSDFLNKVKLKGKLNKPRWSFTDNEGVLHYSAILKIKRTEEITDYIPVYLTQDLIKTLPQKEIFVEIVGSIKSKIIRKKPVLYVNASSIELSPDEEYLNYFMLKGFLSKKHSSMVNPKHNVYMAEHNITLYELTQTYSLPLISWKNIAQSLSTVPENTHVYVYGRIQSKKPIKSFDLETTKSNFTFKLNVLDFSVKS